MIDANHPVEQLQHDMAVPVRLAVAANAEPVIAMHLDLAAFASEQAKAVRDQMISKKGVA